MFKRIFSLILTSVLLPFIVIWVPAESAVQKQPEPTDNFEALLNLNYCYGASFCDEAIAGGALLSLLEFSKEDECGFRSLEKAQLDYFISAYYGRRVDFSACGFEVEGDRVLIPAMGYDLYTHTLISAEESGNRVKVLSKVVCNGHDGVMFDALCTSIFIKNAKSPFGYNLVSSEILN